MFTASGLLVRYLKVFEKSGYNSVKWVRYLSKANGSYQIRVSAFDSRLPRRLIGGLIRGQT
jgi:AP-2 complex subunit mu-1